MTSDQRLLLELREGSATAVQQWFQQYYPRLLRMVVARVGSETDAEEISQETFVNCLRHLPLFRGDSSLWTWMQSIARHEISDYFRKRYAKKAIHALPLSELLEDAQIADAHETAERVKQAIHSLKTEWQELLQLKYIDGKSLKEIAAELGRTIKAVEAELYRARQAFKEAYLALDGPVPVVA